MDHPAAIVVVDDDDDLTADENDDERVSFLLNDSSTRSAGSSSASQRGGGGRSKTGPSSLRNQRSTAPTSSHRSNSYSGHSTRKRCWGGSAILLVAVLTGIVLLLAAKGGSRTDPASDAYAGGRTTTPGGPVGPTGAAPDDAANPDPAGADAVSPPPPETGPPRLDEGVPAWGSSSGGGAGTGASAAAAAAAKGGGGGTGADPSAEEEEATKKEAAATKTGKKEEGPAAAAAATAAPTAAGAAPPDPAGTPAAENKKQKKDAAAKKAKPVVPVPPPKVPVVVLPVEALPPGFHKTAQATSDTYLPRGKELSPAERAALAATWGAWTFVDANAATRPALLYVAKADADASGGGQDGGDFPNGDIPRAAFAPHAWQTDPEYLALWLPQAIALAARGMEAILAEYGHAPLDAPDLSFAERSAMFALSPSAAGYSLKHPPGNGGYATAATLVALKKRLLHAVLTEGAFIFVMGGHSAAAGHGNHFQQSYTLQVQRVLEPVLARLGVHHVSHNYGFGGMGTVQNGLAPRDLYGPRLDVVLWDSGMTEGEPAVKDLFARGALLAGNAVPVLWNEPDGGRYDHAAAGAGQIQTGFFGTAHAQHGGGGDLSLLVLLLLLLLLLLL